MCAFLGLAEIGAIIGVELGEYTSSEDNKKYAQIALKLLFGDESLANSTPQKIWTRFMDAGGYDMKKRHNNQMNVVLALWHEKLLAKH